MYVCMHVCMYVYLHVGKYGSSGFLGICIRECVYVCMYVTVYHMVRVLSAARMDMCARVHRHRCTCVSVSE